jgi:formate hydrogenlyase subunit 3/multisubunit Na+/H+ antiporter MnhD subunit
MNENRIMQQISAIFSVFMVFFYLGVGVYMLFFFKNTFMDRSALVIFGSVLIFYGVYRAYRAYLSIVDLFFRKNREDYE